MDLRHLVLNLFAVTCAAQAGGGPLKSYPLDERSVYNVRLSRKEPTTCVFPGPLQAIVGANVTTQAEDSSGVLLSHEPGTQSFSLRALKDDATGGINILFRGKVYVLNVVTESAADRAVMFLDEPLTGGGARKRSPDTLRALLESARQQDRSAAGCDQMQVQIDRAQPGIVTAYRNFTATIETVTRFEAEDALVFRVRLQTPLALPVPYDPHGLAIRLDREFFPAAYAEASGAIPARGMSYLYFVISGGPVGRANLSVREKFSVIVPRP